jgi:hypothetical protein
VHGRSSWPALHMSRNGAAYPAEASGALADRRVRPLTPAVVRLSALRRYPRCWRAGRRNRGSRTLPPNCLGPDSLASPAARLAKRHSAGSSSSYSSIDGVLAVAALVVRGLLDHACYAIAAMATAGGVCATS